MSVRRCAAAVIAAIVAFGAAAEAPTDLPSLLECMRANVPEQGRIQDLELTTVDNGAPRLLKARLYGQDRPGRVSLMLQVRAPADLKGAAWLFRRTRAADGTATDETFVFLPSVGKVRRVSGGVEDQSLFGTALSFEDVHQLLSSFGGGALSLGATSVKDGRPLRRVYLVARPDANVGYDKIEAGVDLESCVVVDAELFRNEEVRKRLQVDPASLRRLGPHWYPSLTTVEDLRSGLRTELRVLQAELAPRLASRYFEPATFYRE